MIGRLGIPLLCVLALLCAAAPARAQDVELEVRTYGQRQSPLACARFTQKSGPSDARVGQELRDILLNDLDFSGVFAVKNSPPPGNGSDLAAAKRAGLEAVIVGDYSVQGSTVLWEVRLLDASFAKQVAGKRYQGSRTGARQIAHAFADAVVEAWTGKAGVAQTRIAFVSEVGRNKEIFIADYDGHNVRQLTKMNDLVLAPAWAQDDRSIFYTSYHAGNPNLYRTVLATGAFERVSAYKGLNTAAAVSPDGSELALTLSRDGNSEVYLLNLATKRLRRLTFGTAVDTQPTWSPNGQEIAFVSDREGAPQIYIMDRVGADVRRLTYGVGYTTSPSWSPQGDRIAFVGRQGGAFQLMTVTPQGSELRQLTSGRADCEDPSWSPDGRHLVYSRAERGRPTEIWTIRADGSGARPVVARATNCTAPAWSP